MHGWILEFIYQSLFLFAECEEREEFFKFSREMAITGQ